MNIDKRYYINAKLFKDIKEINPNETIDIEVMGKKVKGVFTLLTINGIKSKITITEFDKCIVDAIFTIYTLGLTEFSFHDLVRTMIISNVDKISQKQISSIRGSINKLCNIELTIDATKEMIKRKIILDGDKYVLNGLMLPVKPMKVKTANNKYVDGYRLTEDAILFRYVESTKQALCIDCKFISADLRYSDENVVLINYIIRRIEQYKNNKNSLDSNRIIFARYDKDKKTNKGMYYDLGYLVPDGIPLFKNWRDKKTKINKTIIKILDRFVENNYIHGYLKLVGSNKTIRGYELILSK